ncbi:M20 family metallopeptidase [Carnobacterium funditum]|uniref:M20 family metallopeptidase n=1 Tax=Carnobacterium funditum TaxID=2752 RepID=UPI0005510F93|nr:M20 family metallopeptidase [Carnobacterium funditum]
MKTFIQEQHKTACIETIKTLISYPSYLREDDKGDTPFGDDIQAVLEKTLTICEELGMKSYLDPEGYYGYADYGEGEESLAILCHLDVVPPGNLDLWESNPFKATERNDAIYGRGSQDDKGPAMAALYAFKAVVDSGVTFKKRIRFIFGTDEETLWRCLDRYNELEKPSTMGFAPDAEFPLTYAEKGLLQIKLHGPGDSDLRINCGKSLNIVPDEAGYQGYLNDKLENELKSLGFDYQLSNEKIIVKGKAVHSKDAPEGINAITRLVTALFPHTENKTMAFITEKLNNDPTGQTIFGKVQDDISGPLTVNLATLVINETESTIGLDLRIPVTGNKEDLVGQLITSAEEYQLTYEEYDYLASLYVSKDSLLVTTLLDVYREKTGDKSDPLTSGGATFARTMKNCVAFGAVFPDSEVTFHMPNEKMTIRDIYNAMDIYAESIYRLACK